MLVSYQWLHEHFESPLPKPEELKQLLTVHAFEVEGIAKKDNDTVLDIDILPNRASDCLSHYGIAKEIGTLLDRKVSPQKVFDTPVSSQGEIAPPQITLQEPSVCSRYIGRIVQNVSVGDSPSWLKAFLETIGQKPINNIVDATNFVMFELGQPLHAFDANKLDGGEIFVRFAKKGESIVTLDGKEVGLDEKTLVIADEKEPIAIAGIKGGKKAEVDGDTKNIVLEAANFDPVSVRKTSNRLGIRTDSSKRFENEITSAMAASGMGMVSSLIASLEEGVSLSPLRDNFPQEKNDFPLLVDPSHIFDILGLKISHDELENIFKRLDLSFEKTEPLTEFLKHAPKCEGGSYRYGSRIHFDAPKAFDGASLVAYLFHKAGIRIPLRMVDQYVFGSVVDEEKKEPGDVIFSNTGEEESERESFWWLPGTKVSGGVDHAGVYLGDGKVLHASRKEGRVLVEALGESEYFKNILGIRRIIPQGETFYLLRIPSRRLDMNILEDITEEVGRIHGYEKISEKALPAEGFQAKTHKLFFYANKIRDLLTEAGFSEVLTHAFRPEGKLAVQNPVAQDRSYLRKTLSHGMGESLAMNVNRSALLGNEIIQAFEIGTIFDGNEEWTALCLGVRDTMSKKEKRVSQVYQDLREKFKEKIGASLPGEPNGGVLEFSLDALLKGLPDPESFEEVLQTKEMTTAYKPFSVYPYVLRDLAVFLPEKVDRDEILAVVREEAGELLVQASLFDIFHKTFENGSKKVSYAYHLVFQSYDRTLSDQEIGKIMQNAEKKLAGKEGFEVR